MSTLNSDVTVNLYNNFYLFSMKYLYRNDSHSSRKFQLIFEIYYTKAFKTCINLN